MSLLYIYIYIYIYDFPVNIKLTQLCKSTILQLKITKKRIQRAKPPPEAQSRVQYHGAWI